MYPPLRIEIEDPGYGRLARRAPTSGWPPPHPDMPGEELGLPAETEEDAKADSRRS
jgi:hypothetical protein